VRVQPDLAVGQVVVVEQQQVGQRAAHEGRHLGQLPADLELEPVGPAQGRVVAAVEPDGDPVVAQRRPGRVRGLPHGGRGDLVALGAELEGQQVDAGLLQPLGGPGAEVAARGLLEGAEEVVERGVAEGVLGEVGPQALEEGLPPT
jgi:hypothetical protein